MSNTYGEIYRFTIFGQSHAPAIGVCIEGLPAGSRIDMAKLQAFLDRRAPGQGTYTTARKEADRPEFLSGMSGEYSCGAPLTAIIRNTDTRSGDYEYMKYIPRPGHADYPAMIRYGLEERDYAGGGQFSGRLTAPLCIAGGIALQMLEGYGITVKARIASIGGETDPARIRELLEEVKAAGDSIGGIIECVIEGLPAGLGDPMFDGMENRIARAAFGIPAVKGIEFGDGFGTASMRGSENNDAFCLGTDGRIETLTNHAGGILGGMTTGMPLTFRTAFKPTPSIAKEQQSVDVKNKKTAALAIRGRHDPCIVLRAVPVVEAAAACAVYDALLAAEAAGFDSGSGSFRQGS